MKKWLLIAVLLLSALILRGIYPSNTVIGFDQVQILENVHRISKRDFTLIGPRTGPANMFTGPLIYYLSTPFVLLFGEVWSITLVPLFLACITGTMLYVLLQKYVSKKEALLGLTLWTFSPFLVDLDRTLWNPNLSILAASLLFIPLLGKKHDKNVLFFLFCGAFLSYQAHFSGFLMVALAGMTIIVFKKPWLLLIAIAAGLVLSLLPTILFDLRNNFLNAHGFITLFSGSGGITASNILKQFLQTSLIVTQVTGMFFVFGMPATLLLTGGLILLGTGIYIARTNQNIQKSLLWISCATLAYTLYKGEKPEYYFFLLIPALILISVTLLSKLGQKALTLFLVIFITYSCWFAFTKHRTVENLTLGVLTSITAQLENEQVKTIVYDIFPGQDFGAKYFFRNIPLTQDGKIIHISYPNTYRFSWVTEYGNVGVWADPRVGTNNYITTDAYILSSAPTIQLHTVPSANNPTRLFDYYVVQQNNIPVGDLSVTETTNQKATWLQECVQSTEGKKNTWVSQGKNNYFLSAPDHCLLFESNTLTPEAAHISIY